LTRLAKVCAYFGTERRSDPCRSHARRRALSAGGAAGPRALEGITISIKDLFDVAGEVTTAGSTVLRSRAPATADAPAVARLRAAGAVLFGRTNMVEFAFSGVGINPHYGTPRNRWQREDAGGHVPGGSSSGAGVSVADGMCVAALGTDTGGSVRILLPSMVWSASNPPRSGCQ
jgi:aspartyl-tRNA(Asn)/glutamyl-tRNA(Gln) amidotransferase subunit A